jgi:hypothetical protein
VPSLFFNVSWLAKVGSIHPAAIGLSCIQLVSFYILIFNDRGLSTSLPVSILLLVSMSAMKNYRKRRSLLLEIRKTLICDIPVVIFSIAIFCVHWRTPLIKYISPIPATANNDMISFAQVAQHITSHGFGDAGRILGLSAGPFARETVPGVFSSIVFSSQILRQSIAYSLLPVLGVMTLILALSFQKIIWEFTKSKVFTTAIAVFAQSTPLFFFVSYQYFLAQIQAITFLVAIFAVSISQRSVEKIDRPQFMAITIQSFIIAAMFLTYPQYVVLQLAIFIVVVFEFQSLKRLIRNLFSAFLIFAIGSVMIFPNLFRAINRTLDLAADSTSGWPMPWVTPSQLIGFQWNVFRAPMEGEIYFSFAIIFVYILFYVNYCNKTILNKVFNRLILFTSVTYALMILRNGPNSYVQFKWISTLGPLLVFCVVSIVLINAPGNFKFLPKICYSLAAFALIFSNLARTLWYDSQHASKIGVLDETKSLPKLPAVKLHESLNVKTGTYRESMWPAFFLMDTNVAILDPSYYSTVQPMLAPTLVSTDFPTAPFVNRDKINKTYDLIYPRTDQASFELSLAKATIEIEESPLEFVVNSSAPLILTVKNDGKVSWSGSGSFKGAVNLGIRTISRNGLSHSQELAHCPIVEFPNYVSPNASFEVTCAIAFTESGKYELELTPISEGEAWFSDVVPANRLVIVVDVISV